MLLRNVCIVGNNDPRPKELLLENENIRAILQTGTLQTAVDPDKTIVFENAIAFPGLINSHDHLDFNLFPQLGNRVYNNYREWGTDIHHNDKDQIDSVLQVPQPLRTQWGIYKNLLNGFTTVVNHGDHLPVTETHIDVYQHTRTLHSVGFEKNWKWKLNKPRMSGQPFVIHVGEGTDQLSAKEIDKLIRWNLFKKDIIGVHGVAMNTWQAAFFRALVWCPASNYFLLNQTAEMDKLKKQVRILFGTDSTLTSGWNSWEHIRKARNTGMLTDRELFESLTSNPAAAWKLGKTGSLQPGYKADLVIARAKGKLTRMETFFGLDPAAILLVIKDGRIKLFDESIRNQLAGMGLPMHTFSDFFLDGTRKYCAGDLPKLIADTHAYHNGLNLPVQIPLVQA